MPTSKVATMRDAIAALVTEVIRADPDRTLIPGLIVDAVVVEPLGGHPSSTHGYHGRDRHFSMEWDAISRERTTLDAWLVDWLHSLPDRAAYTDRLGPCVAARMRPTGTAPSGSGHDGRYQ